MRASTEARVSQGRRLKFSPQSNTWSHRSSSASRTIRSGMRGQDWCTEKGQSYKSTSISTPTKLQSKMMIWSVHTALRMARSDSESLPRRKRAKVRRNQLSQRTPPHLENQQFLENQRVASRQVTAQMLWLKGGLSLSLRHFLRSTWWMFHRWSSQNAQVYDNSLLNTARLLMIRCLNKMTTYKIMLQVDDNSLTTKHGNM